MKKEHTRCLREGWAIIVGGPMAFLVLLFPLLIGCGSTTTPSAKSMTTITLGLPAQALASPTVGSLPGATLLGVRLTLKPSRDTKSGATILVPSCNGYKCSFGVLNGCN